MGKLKQMPSKLTAAPSRLSSIGQGSERERSRMRDAAVHWRKWYKTARWKDLRWTVLERDLFTCRRCGHVEGDTRFLVADHRQPHRGDEALFWEPTNLQCLCKACHDGAKQSEERRGV
ncbi:HNH endonuclease [Haematobacter missouriensis]|uniref:Putative HNH nuclease YajD n=2 Tax=Haematobacter missouriensis TaxID=366616 RepID=A0A212AHZ5_9RHOB|nr:HNH endonuclease [Haematobacter missouriensis]OWJ72409.1 HNH endonuclease [Haematobacter missouriensis]OWJ81087.1 HNH endonuclease [Haematobacter missouriensis]